MTQSVLINDWVRKEETKKVEPFILNQLKDFAFPKDVTVHVTLKYTSRKSGFVTCKVKSYGLTRKERKMSGGQRTLPWIESRILVRDNLVYPTTVKIPIGSVRVKDPVAKVLMKADWYYEFKDLTFNGPSESFVYGVGFAMFKVLRGFDLVPGRASRVGQATYGIKWLDDYRAWVKQESQPKSLSCSILETATSGT